MEVREVSTEEEVRAVSAVVLQLRTHLSEQDLVSAVGRMRREGYRLIAAYDDGGGDPVGAAISASTRCWPTGRSCTWTTS